MQLINNFMEVFKDQNYDRINNPNKLPIKDLLPTGIYWSIGNTTHTIVFESCAVVRLLSDMSGIAIVEIENETLVKQAHAYIINADGTKRFEIQLPAWATEDGRFNDVYYIGNDLCFFFFANHEDYRMIVDAGNGNIKDILISR